MIEKIPAAFQQYLAQFGNTAIAISAGGCKSWFIDGTF
jgi:hypothetical protein